MIDTKALRQKILDLAIRGKLVPQDPDDEPASVLLERIRQQKQQMVKEGKLKPKDIKNDSVIFVGEDNLHYEKFADGSVKCIEDEIPFDLPEGWAWCRLSMVGTTSIGLTYKPTEVKETGTIVLRSCNIKNGKIDFADLVRVQADIRENQYIYENDILICARNGSQSLVGKCAIMQDLPEAASFGAFMAVFRSICNQYVYYYFNTALFRSSFSNDDSKQINQVTQAILRDTLIPLPPFAEQTRIVAKLHEILSLADFINDGTEQIEMIITKAKSKILDLAIRGQLVPQDPDDEPASVLLERIRAEKEELIKQGKLKRDKKESVIFRGEDNSYYEKVGSDVICIDAEIPFEIPDTWEWMRLESCCIKEIRRGKSPTYIDESGTLVFAQKCNTKYRGIDVGLALFLDESILGRYPDDEYMQDGDVVINSTGTGTLGRVGIYHTTDNHRGLPIVPDSHVTVVRAAHGIQSIYVYAFMKANQSELEKEGEGSTNQKELKPLTLKEMLIPIPPYSEQERIATTITAAFSILSAVEKSLS